MKRKTVRVRKDDLYRLRHVAGEGYYDDSQSRWVRGHHYAQLIDGLTALLLGKPVVLCPECMKDYEGPGSKGLVQNVHQEET